MVLTVSWIPGRFMMNRLSAAADTGIHKHAYDYRTTFSYSYAGAKDDSYFYFYPTALNSKCCGN